MLDMREVLEKLCAVAAPSGYEAAATSLAAELLKPFVERVEIDRLGNLTGYLPCGRNDVPTLMLDAHLDEIGVMVTAWEDGYARFRAIGKLDPRIMPAQTVRFLTDPSILGVVACLPPHVQTEQKTVQSIEELFIDTGGVEVPAGTVGVWEAHAFTLGDKLFSAKSLDDRACFAVLLRALELLPAVELLRGRQRSVDILVCGSVMEELGHIGAETAAYAQMPDYAVILDAGFGKSPDSAGDNVFKLGSGPILTLGPECNRRLTDSFQTAAKEAGISVQLEVCPRASGTNVAAYQVSREGVPSAVLGVPLKYMHTCVETVHLNDLENAARLLAEWITAFCAEGGDVR